MSGQLVIAELSAFRMVLGKAQRQQGGTIQAWSRSTITNALHRLGPAAGLSDAAQFASEEVGAMAQSLADDGCPDAAIETARSRAIQAVDALISRVRRIKAETGDLPDPT